MSWIHIDDLVSIIEWSIGSDTASGVYNATAPNPVTNAEFTRALARALSRPAVIPVPAFALHIAVGEMAGPLLLTGQKVLPNRALGSGFRFQHETIETALASLVR